MRVQKHLYDDSSAIFFLCLVLKSAHDQTTKNDQLIEFEVFFAMILILSYLQKASR